MLPLILGAGGLAYALAAQNAVSEGLSGLAQPPYKNPPRYPVTLISPAYLEYDYIGGLLTSATNQTEPFFELIVVDSSPISDYTRNKAKSLSARVLFSEYGNIAKARNTGALAARGDILVFADSDVILSSHFVESAVSELSQGYALVYPQEAIHDSAFWNLATYAGLSLVRWHGYTTRCVACWKDAFIAVGGYDESCNPLEKCREDLTIGRRMMAHYGESSVKLLNTHIATSARRWSAFGWDNMENFAQAVR